MNGTKQSSLNKEGRLSLSMLVGVVGLSFAIACMMGVMLVGPDLLLGAQAPRLRAAGLREALVLAAVAAYAVLFFAAHTVSAGRLAVLLAFSVGGAAALAACVALVDLRYEVQLCLVAVSGVGLAALTALWFCIANSQPHHSTLFYVSVSAAMGMAECLVGLCLVTEAIRICLVLSYAGSLACAALLVCRKTGALNLEVVSNGESDKRSKILKTSALMLAVSNFEFGIVAMLSDDSVTRIACFSTALLVLVVLAFDFTHRKLVSERSVSPHVPPVTVAALACLFLFGSVVRIVALCVLSMLCSMYLVLGLAALIEHVRISHLSALRVFGKAQLFNCLGLAVGIAFGYALLFYAGAGGGISLRLAVGAALVYGFIAAYCHKARFPEENMVDDKGRAAPPEAKGLWRRRCRALSDQCDLSERQFEVLMLIAQGRNAKYIEQALSISLSTAQTHIRNIYRKVGVHSRQELLDLIEKTKLYGEE